MEIIKRMLNLSQDQPITKDPTVYIVFHVITALALLGQLFTIFTYRSIRNRKNKFYGYVAIHSLIGIPCTLVNYPIMFHDFKEENNALCGLYGFIFAYCYLVYMLWSTYISWVIYASLKHEKQIKSLKWTYVVCAYILAFFIKLYPLLKRRFGPYDGEGIIFCWYNMREKVDAAIFIGYYIPLGATTLFSFYCYLSSYLIIRKTGDTEARKQFFKFIIFPMMQIVCNSGLVLKWISTVTIGRFTQGFEIVHVILSKGQGFFEALAYFCNKSVRTEIQKVWCLKPRKNRRLLPPPTVFDEDTISTEISQRIDRTMNSNNSMSYQGTYSSYR